MIDSEVTPTYAQMAWIPFFLLKHSAFKITFTMVDTLVSNSTCASRKLILNWPRSIHTCRVINSTSSVTTYTCTCRVGILIYRGNIPNRDILS